MRAGSGSSALFLDTTPVQKLFKKRFGYTPVHIIAAPGRVELLGGYAHYYEGLAMSVALDRYLFIAAAPRTDGRIELVSSAFSEPDSFWISNLSPSSNAAWADPIKAVLTQLRKRGAHFTGFSAAIHGTIPLGAGMGSSTALAVATALTVRRLWPYRLTELGVTVPPRRDERGRLPPLENKERTFLARLIQAAEAGVSNTSANLRDPLSILFGKSVHVLNIDCRFHTVDCLPLIGETIVVCDSGAPSGRNTSEVEAIRCHCQSAARALRAKNLRSVEPAYLRSNRQGLTEREYECAYYAVGEIQRVLFAERALREDDHYQMGQYLLQSHKSARDFLRNSTAELDLLVELARAHPACLGARLSGLGFGGATVNLVRYHQVEEFVESLARHYQERTGKAIAPMVCRIVDGAQ